VRVLVDRHHHGLFYGLQLLFEDRLGGTVYTPLGHEWWDEGYWRFGEVYGDDRLARQFLAADRPGEWAAYYPNDPEGERWYLGHDNHHPERRIIGIELGAAKGEWFGGKWDYVVATVPDNEAGFKRFADEHGAQFVVQVGNTAQMVNWGLDPLALVSSEVPIRGRGVLMHQPFDHETTFAYREPIKSKTIRSFVNCFGSTRCSAQFEEAWFLLPEYFFANHGIDGPNGNVETVAEIAQLMASSAWGWHDKEQGDGFGHVIHQWAAIGRPIIGHASHYRGRMAEPFWQDGVTCIDLDRHSVGEVAEIIRGTSVAKHREMCEAIRAEFDKIDWDGETEAIRDLLGIRMAVAA
jgi:hypothetical protein